VPKLSASAVDRQINAGNIVCIACREERSAVRSFTSRCAIVSVIPLAPPVSTAFLLLH
jgi:hypothetical protein